MFQVSMKHWYSGMHINLQGIITHNIAIFPFLCTPFLLLYKQVVSEAKSESRPGRIVGSSNVILSEKKSRALR